MGGHGILLFCDGNRVSDLTGGCESAAEEWTSRLGAAAGWREADALFEGLETDSNAIETSDLPRDSNEQKVQR